MLSLLLALAFTQPVAVPVVDVGVVCPDIYWETLQPWIAHRQRQGHGIVRIANQRTAAELRNAVRAAANKNPLRFLLLVGDTAGRDASLEAHTPTYFARARVNVLWGSEPEIATDNWFADLDDDQVPDLAVGRLPVDSTGELAALIARIQHYEQHADHGDWRRRVNFIAGIGGFGALADSILEMTTKKFLTSGIPACYDTTMTYASWRSPYCPDPRRFHDTAVERFNEGSLFWVYIGHGQKTHLDHMHVPGRAYPIMDADHVKELKTETGPPIAVFFSCYAGAFDQPRDCLAEEMLRAAGGPVAVLCGSRVTMPYAMGVLADGMLVECFQHRRETLGEVVLHAKRQLARDIPADELQQNSNRQLLEALAAAISPARDKLAEERREHLLLFNLLGDPLLRLPSPDTVVLRCDATLEAGTSCLVRGSSPLPGQCTIELACRRDRTRSIPPVRKRFDGDPNSLSLYDNVYQMVNDSVWVQRTVAIPAGDFELTLDIPHEARGAGHLRAFVQSSNDHALGAVDVFLRRPKTP